LPSLTRCRVNELLSWRCSIKAQKRGKSHDLLLDVTRCYVNPSLCNVTSVARGEFSQSDLKSLYKGLDVIQYFSLSIIFIIKLTLLPKHHISYYSTQIHNASLIHTPPCLQQHRISRLLGILQKPISRLRRPRLHCLLRERCRYFRINNHRPRYLS